MQHIIKKQVIELEIDKRLDAFDIQQQVSNWYWHQFLSLLEIELNKLSVPGEVQTIDRLEIDLGVINITQLQKTQLNNIVLPAVTQQIQQCINSVQQNTSIVRKQAGSLHSFTQWLQYMQKGHLPWNVLHVTDAWLHQVLEALATDHYSVTLLRTELQKNKTVCTRIVQQHTSNWLVQLITVLTAENQSRLPDTIAEIEKLFISLNQHTSSTAPIAVVSSRKQLWQQVLHTVATSQQKLTTTQLATIIIAEHITSKHGTVLEKIVSQPADYPQLHAVIATVHEQMRQTAPTEQQQIAPKEPAKRKEQSPGGDAPQQGADTTQKLLAAADGLFVQHAGLVLLHPFLRSLFSLCGFLEGKEFSNETNKEKGVYLLHYIATGNTTAEEHELVIPKILCNYPIEGAINTDTTLLANELQEADDLMQAAIAQWSILKNTSPDGLRQGFLQRNGKLHTKNGQLYMEVEKNAIDVLLDHLPWNMSLIKLPWSGNIIRVEWR
jgi:hypothetical protein